MIVGWQVLPDQLAAVIWSHCQPTSPYIRILFGQGWAAGSKNLGGQAVMWRAAHHMLPGDTFNSANLLYTEIQFETESQNYMFPNILEIFAWFQYS